MAQRVGRSDAAWKRVRRQVLRGAQVCHICGGALDFQAAPRSPLSPSVDHIVPLAMAQGLDAAARSQIALDVANLRPAHYGCNSRRGARRPVVRRKASQAW